MNKQISTSKLRNVSTQADSNKQVHRLDRLDPLGSFFTEVVPYLGSTGFTKEQCETGAPGKCLAQIKSSPMLEV